MATQHEDSPVVQWAKARGMKTGQPSEYEVQQDMHQHLDEAQGLVRPEAPQPPRMGRLKKVAAIGALGAASAGIATLTVDAYNAYKSNQDVTEQTDDEKNTATYTVQPGDNAWNIGERVERNIDGEAGNQDVRPFVDDIYKQLTSAKRENLPVGTQIEIPAKADTDPQADGVQLNQPGLDQVGESPTTIEIEEHK